jgi:hypothetical protein
MISSVARVFIILNILICTTATNQSPAQPNVVKENSTDQQSAVTSPKAGTLEVTRRVQIKLDLI